MYILFVCLNLHVGFRADGKVPSPPEEASRTWDPYPLRKARNTPCDLPVWKTASEAENQLFGWEKAVARENASGKFADALLKLEHAVILQSRVEQVVWDSQEWANARMGMSLLLKHYVGLYKSRGCWDILYQQLKDVYS